MKLGTSYKLINDSEKSIEDIKNNNTRSEKEKNDIIE